MQDGITSGRISEAVAVILSKFLRSILGRDSDFVFFLQTNVRKIAHAVEFFILGVSATSLLILLRWVNGHMVAHVFLLVLGVAVTDEAIQGFVAYRGSQVQDILLDFIGGTTGILSMLSVWAVWRCIFTRRKNVA